LDTSAVFRFLPLARMALNSFIHKFRCALRGVAIGTRGQTSFLIHLIVTALVIGVAAWVVVTPVEWCLLALCIMIVLALELFNSSIESLARAIDRKPNDQLRDALDIASGAVLVGAVGAAIVGVVVLVPKVLLVAFG
jgi:diacylglycerol kinase